MFTKVTPLPRSTGLAGLSRHLSRMAYSWLPSKHDRRQASRYAVLLISLAVIFSLVLVSSNAPHVRELQFLRRHNDVTEYSKRGHDGVITEHKSSQDRKRVGQTSENTPFTPFSSTQHNSSDNEHSSTFNTTGNSSGVTVPPSKPPVGPALKTNYDLNCTALIDGNDTERHKAKMYLNSGTWSPPGDDHFVEITDNCLKFRQERGYPGEPSSPLEAAFPIAFSIRMHRSAAQAEKLLRAIYMPQNVYCVHIDKNSPAILHSAMAAIAECLPNVFISTLSLNYIYGSFSPVEADLHCMRELLETGVQWKYYLNLAGSEFPLKTNLELVHILRYLNGTNDVEQFYFPQTLRYRIEMVYVNLKLSRKNLVTRRHKEDFGHENVTLMKGCSYNTFSRAFVEWVLTDKLAQAFIEWSKDTSSPDETVWATLNHIPGAPGGYPVEVHQHKKTFLSREVIWRWNAIYCSTGEYIHQICIMGYGNLKWLVRRWELFANKFDYGKDPVILDCLGETLRDRTKRADPAKTINWKRIERMPHVAYQRGLGRIQELDNSIS